MNIRDAMLNKILEVGPYNVSHHSANLSKLNVIDIAPKTLNNKMEFFRLLKNSGAVDVNKLFAPWTPIYDDAIHVEIKQ